MELRNEENTPSDFGVASGRGKGDAAGMKRPLTHVCAVFVFALFIAVNVMQLMNGVRDVASLALAAFCAIQLLGMFVAPRDKRQHRLGTVLLALIAMSTLYNLSLLPCYRLYIHVPGARGTWAMVVMNALASGAIFYLAYDFACGEQSRRFFGLPEKK